VTGEEAGSEQEDLGRINVRLREIADLLSDPDTPDGDAVALAREAAGLVGEALEQTEKAVAGLEQED
jgi:hypothetical protein